MAASVAWSQLASVDGSSFLHDFHQEAGSLGWQWRPPFSDSLLEVAPPSKGSIVPKRQPPAGKHRFKQNLWGRLTSKLQQRGKTYFGQWFR